MAPISLVVAVSRPLLRFGVEQALRKHADVALRGLATTAEELGTLVARHPDALILSEVTLNGYAVFGTKQSVRAVTPHAPIVFIVGDVSADILLTALNGGAQAVVSTTAAIEEIIHMLRRVERGDNVLIEQVLGHAAAARAVVQAYAVLAQNDRILFPEVPTRLELDVLQGLAIGLTKPQLADRLGVHESTVRERCTRLYQRLNVNNRIAAVRIGIERGYIAERLLRDAIAAERARGTREPTETESGAYDAESRE